MSLQFATSPVEILAWQRRVLSEPRLSHTASRIATSLSLFINSRSGVAWPSLRTLARVSNTSYSSVKRAIRRMVELQLLQVERGNARRVNRYRAILPSEASGSAPRPEVEPRPEPDATPAVARPVDDATIARVVAHLNRAASACFPDAPGTATYRILRRALHRHSPEVLCAVVDLKAAQWGQTEQARYLRPATLFTPAKLEGYLSELHQRGRPGARPPALDPPEASVCEAHGRSRPASAGMVLRHLAAMRSILE
ncbi:conserved phage C-terminal domain-containing protein [Marichromatium bheemlicum]|uniref:Phage conserved hypothetical protein C-terminal domain-containing protein n=1 Tax=Marichromatium bheemlicum TaxID=365339 RepID=A0ABX1I9K7_9GAMM|nr:conserved phage C-terminal domain-containing protein [Marichromatium bheemlicum]NKN32892.1 hypothetical protein [Marichromatium bheemlicum]